MHAPIFRILTLSLTAALASASPGCTELVVACAADGSCPGGQTCVDGICKAGLAAPTGGDDASADSGATADTGPALCEPELTVAPTPRGEICGGMVGGKMWVMYGDDGVPVNCNPALSPAADAWVYDPCSGWSKAPGEPGTSLPAPRARSASAVDDQNGYLYVYGGRFRDGSSGPYVVRPDLWMFDAAADKWLLLSASGPPPRSNGILALQRSTQQLWIHGGNASNSGLSFLPLGDTWRYDMSAGMWSAVTTQGAQPPKRLFHSGAITSDDKYLVVFGGGGANAWTGPFYHDTWRLDLATLTWEEIGKSGDRPEGRIKTGLIALPGTGELLLFGGHDDGAVGNRNDLWRLDVAAGTWKLVHAGDLGVGGDPTKTFKPANAFCDFPPDFMDVDQESPERREGFLWNYDLITGRIWMFGGKADCGPLHDIWSLDPTTLVWKPEYDATEGWSCVRFQSPCNTLCN